MIEHITKIDCQNPLGFAEHDEQNIIAYYVESNTEKGSWYAKSEYIYFIRKYDITAYVGYSKTEVEIVESSPPYLRSKPNNTTSDNLMSLPNERSV
jgi:hypothetical protein